MRCPALLCVAAFSFVASLCPGGERPPAVKLLTFDGPRIPVNKDGAEYPNQYAADGTAGVTLDKADAVSGQSLRFEVTKGVFYAQFNAHNPDGSRGFAREYVAEPAKWRFNTINRLTFWVQSPANGRPLRTGGQQNMDVGTYTKRVRNADTHSDEAGGGHWYHMLNIAPTGTWTKVIVNTHPHHYRGDSGGKEQGNRPHPTREKDYNYFDTLTRFYISAEGRPLIFAHKSGHAARRAAESRGDEQKYCNKCAMGAWPGDFFVVYNGA